MIKDLVVDMEPFFEKNLAVQPWLQPAGPAPERERLVDPVQWAEAEPYTNCILCACCHGVCPAAERDPQYWGQRPWPSTIVSWPTSVTPPMRRE